MKVKKYKSSKEIIIKVSDYKIDWQKAPSKGQQILQDFLYKYWSKCLVLSEMRVPGTKWRFDIVNCNKKIIVEFSPTSHHNNYNQFFHKSRAGYLRSIKADLFKFDWAMSNGFKLIEIVDDDLNKLSPDYILEKFGINIL